MPESVVQLVRLAPEGTSADLSVDVGGLPRATASEDLADPEHPVWKWTELGPAPTYVRLEHTWYGSGGNDVPRTFWTAFCRPTGGAGGAGSSTQATGQTGTTTSKGASSGSAGASLVLYMGGEFLRVIHQWHSLPPTCG